MLLFSSSDRQFTWRAAGTLVNHGVAVDTEWWSRRLFRACLLRSVRCKGTTREAEWVSDTNALFWSGRSACTWARWLSGGGSQLLPADTRTSRHTALPTFARDHRMAWCEGLCMIAHVGPLTPFLTAAVWCCAHPLALQHAGRLRRWRRRQACYRQAVGAKCKHTSCLRRSGTLRADAAGGGHTPPRKRLCDGGRLALM